MAPLSLIPHPVYQKMLMMTLSSRYFKYWYLESKYFPPPLLLPPWSNPSSSWTWNVTASWWIFLHPVLLYNLDKTNHVTSSVQHVPVVSSLTQGIFTVIICYIWLLSIISAAPTTLPFIHSPTSTLTSNIFLNSSNMFQHQTSHLLFSLPEIFFPQVPTWSTVSLHAGFCWSVILLQGSWHTTTTSPSIPVCIHSLLYPSCF